MLYMRNNPSLNLAGMLVPLAGPTTTTSCCSRPQGSQSHPVWSDEDIELPGQVKGPSIHLRQTVSFSGHIFNQGAQPQILQHISASAALLAGVFPLAQTWKIEHGSFQLVLLG